MNIYKVYKGVLITKHLYSSMPMGLLVIHMAYATKDLTPFEFYQWVEQNSSKVTLVKITNEPNGKFRIHYLPKGNETAITYQEGLVTHATLTKLRNIPESLQDRDGRYPDM